MLLEGIEERVEEVVQDWEELLVGVMAGLC